MFMSIYLDLWNEMKCIYVYSQVVYRADSFYHSHGYILWKLIIKEEFFCISIFLTVTLWFMTVCSIVDCYQHIKELYFIQAPLTVFPPHCSHGLYSLPIYEPDWPISLLSICQFFAPILQNLPKSLFNWIPFEDGGLIFLWNNGSCLHNHSPEDHSLNFHCHEKLRNILYLSKSIIFIIKRHIT
jgi:hypothetical protein